MDFFFKKNSFCGYHELGLIWVFFLRFRFVGSDHLVGI